MFSDVITTDKKYEEALALWQQELAEFKGLDDIPQFYITAPVYQAHRLIHKGVQDISTILSNIKRNNPDFISIYEVISSVEVFEQTVIYQALKNIVEKDILKAFNEEHRFLFQKSIGYFVYIHYPAGTLQYVVGLSAKYEESADYDEYEDVYEETDTDEISPEKQKQNQIKEEEFRQKVLNYVMLVGVDNRLSLIKNKKQCINFIQEYYPEIMDKTNYNVVVTVAEKAMDYYEMEFLPGRISELVSGGKTDKEISVSTGLSLSRVRKLIALKTI